MLVQKLFAAVGVNTSDFKMGTDAVSTKQTNFYNESPQWIRIAMVALGSIIRSKQIGKEKQ